MRRRTLYLRCWQERLYPLDSLELPSLRRRRRGTMTPADIRLDLQQLVCDLRVFTAAVLRTLLVDAFLQDLALHPIRCGSFPQR